MGQSPHTKIYNSIRSLKVVKHKKRQEFLSEMIVGLIKGRSVIFSELAFHISKKIKTSSVERRIQDFFQKVNIQYDQLALLLLSFVHHEKLELSIDRTEWDFGKTRVNILCVVVSIGKMAVPIYFEMLDNNSGNSNYEDRIQLFTKLINIIGKERISLVLMDREFIGCEWLSWLQEQEIPFCVRVPKHHTILLANGSKVIAEKQFKTSGDTLKENVIVDNVYVNLSISIDRKDELLYLIGTLPAKELKAKYHKRWTIEVFFQALKGRGFRMKDSNLRSLQKYRKLFAIVSIAYTICWATGIQEGRKNPVRTKKHGYPQYSVFRRGLNLIRNLFNKKHERAFFETLNYAFHKALVLQKIKTIG